MIRFFLLLVCGSSIPFGTLGFAVTTQTNARRRRRGVVSCRSLVRQPDTTTTTTTTALLHGSKSSISSSTTTLHDPVVNLLDTAGYGSRLVKLVKPQQDDDDDDEPRRIILEIFVNGQAALAHLVDIVESSSAKNDNNTNNSQQSPPRVVVDLLAPPNNDSSDDDKMMRQIIDLGQITSIWPAQSSSRIDPSLHAKALQTVNKFTSQQNAMALDKLLDKVYARMVRQGRSHTEVQLPKKDDRILPSTTKALRKAGPGYARLLDSALLSDHLPLEKSNSNINSHQQLARMVAAMLLAHDAKLGGRFKRWPSLLLSHNDNKKEWTLINGGWLVVDQNVRAGNEARKLVERSATTTTNNNNNKSTTTATDKRIIQRLECLAMGEILQEDDHDTARGEYRLEKDVRETLRAMELPWTSQGASDALIRMGRWSCNTQSQMKQAIQPWSPEILNAASWYANFSLQDFSDMETTRTDLTKLPAVCVDARTTAFRDDAMSVRPRASTQRWLDEKASKWEILIHITDVSDIYVPTQASAVQGDDSQAYLWTLQQAAASRGVSRYDLPLGPLHLLPPTVLQSLSFSKESPQRCVTLWVFIDERDGKLLDAGFERSLVAAPTQVSYSDASQLMGAKPADLPKDLARIRSILLVVERNLNLWKDQRMSGSEAARKREGRLMSRAANAPNVPMNDADNGRAGFQRTRGHQLVDAGLDMYSFAGQRMLRQRKAPLPMARGADVSRGGRLATAPLRRYIDGQAQRQLLAVLCQHGDAMTLEECRQAGRLANNARNAIANVRAGRQ